MKPEAAGLLAKLITRVALARGNRMSASQHRHGSSAQTRTDRCRPGSKEGARDGCMGRAEHACHLFRRPMPCAGCRYRARHQQCRGSGRRGAHLAVMPSSSRRCPPLQSNGQSLRLARVQSSCCTPLTGAMLNLQVEERMRSRFDLQSLQCPALARAIIVERPWRGSNLLQVTAGAIMREAHMLGCSGMSLLCNPSRHACA